MIDEAGACRAENEVLQAEKDALSAEVTLTIAAVATGAASAT